MVSVITATDLPAHPAWRQGNIADLRPRAEFEAGHFAPAVSLPLPADATEADFATALAAFRLPPRHEPLIVVADDVALAETVAAWLHNRGRPEVGACAMTADTFALVPAGLLSTGPSTGRLWKPPSFLEAALSLLPPPEAGPVVDFGAGSGRASVWLARRGYEVTAIDRYGEALDMGRDLARDSGVTCEWLRADLRRDDEIWSGPWSLALAFRYLERPLLAELPRLLRSGGVAVVNTFRTAPGFDGPPAERHRLRPGELLQLFPSEVFEILRHVEEHDPDGRPSAGIIAKLREIRG